MTEFGKSVYSTSFGTWNKIIHHHLFHIIADEKIYLNTLSCWQKEFRFIFKTIINSLLVRSSQEKDFENKIKLIKFSLEIVKYVLQWKTKIDTSLKNSNQQEKISNESKKYGKFLKQNITEVVFPLNLVPVSNLILGIYEAAIKKRKNWKQITPHINETVENIFSQYSEKLYTKNVEFLNDVYASASPKKQVEVLNIFNSASELQIQFYEMLEKKYHEDLKQNNN